MNVRQPAYGSLKQIRGNLFGFPCQIKFLGMSVSKCFNHKFQNMRFSLLYGV